MTRETFKNNIFERGYRSRYSTVIPLGPTGVSIDSPLVPIFAGKEGTVVTFEGIQGKAVIYNLFKESSMGTIRRNSQFSQFLLETMINVSTQVTPRYITGTGYFSVKGCIFTLSDGIPEVLFTLAFERDYFHTITRDTVDVGRVVAVINKKLLIPEHRYIYLKLKKDVEELNLETLYTNDVNQWCFGNKYQLPVFATLTDRMEYLSNLKNFI